VDGVRYAFKDSVALVVMTLVFGGSVLLGRPILSAFFRQIVNPDTPEREESLGRLLAKQDVRRALATGTLIVTLQSIVSTLINVVLNLRIVRAAFGSEAFNQQVASVNAITRIAFPLLSMAAFFAAVWITYRAIYRRLPAEEGKDKLESNFWTLVEMWEREPSAEIAEAA
jgi:hypothetical protein